MCRLSEAIPAEFKILLWCIPAPALHYLLMHGDELGIEWSIHGFGGLLFVTTMGFGAVSYIIEVQLIYLILSGFSEQTRLRNTFSLIAISVGAAYLMLISVWLVRDF